MSDSLVNTFFEIRVERLFDLLERVKAVFEKAGIEYHVVGGMAVYLHVSCVDEDAGRLTRDVDIAVKRSDVSRLSTVAREFGFEYRNVAGVDMLVDAARPSARRAIHLVFAGEKVRTEYVETVPAFTKPAAFCRGASIAPVVDILTMKLTSFRDEDRVHVRDLDEVGLITAEIEAELSPVLRERLAAIRATE